jgi:L-threonylcarbamoyladenylate synthase
LSSECPFESDSDANQDSSANRSGQPPARSAADVRTYFGDDIDLVIDAELGDADSPSEILDLLSEQRLR